MATVLHQEDHVLQWMIQQSTSTQNHQSNHLADDFDCVLGRDKDRVGESSAKPNTRQSTKSAS